MFSLIFLEFNYFEYYFIFLIFSFFVCFSQKQKKLEMPRLRRHLPLHHLPKRLERHRLAAKHKSGPRRRLADAAVPERDVLLPHGRHGERESAVSIGVLPQRPRAGGCRQQRRRCRLEPKSASERRVFLQRRCQLGSGRLFRLWEP